MLFASLLLAGVSPPAFAQSVSPTQGRSVVWSSARTLTAGQYVFSAKLIVAAPVTIIGVVKIIAPAVTISSYGSFLGVGGGSAGGAGGAAVVGACWVTAGAFAATIEGGSRDGELAHRLAVPPACLWLHLLAVPAVS